MRGNEFLDKISLVDPTYVEAASVSKPMNNIKRRTILLIAAAIMALMLVACSVYSMFAASSEVKTDEFPDITVSERVEAIRDWTIDAYFEHFNELMEEHGIAPEDVVDKIYDEYIRNGYYFDEMIVVTKEKAVARIITDAEKFTFNVEFVGYFYNEKNDEFKTVSQTTTAQGGKIEIVMIAEKGWECFGGILARNHPENEYDYVMGLRSIKYGLPASVRAMQFEDKYFDGKVWITQHNTAYQVHDLVEKKGYWDVYDHLNGFFDPINSDDSIDRIEHIASNCEMVGISNGKTYYNKQTLSDESFVESGYAYDERGAIAFVNSDIQSEFEECFYFLTVFYNAQKDQYRVAWDKCLFSSSYMKGVLKVEGKEGWECIGVALIVGRPETPDFDFTVVKDFVPVAGDEADSNEFFNRLLEEIAITEIQILDNIRYR